MSNAVDPNDPAVSGNTMTDGDFERLLDELHGDGVPRAVVDLAAADNAPSVDRSVLNRTMADEDFDRLLEADNESHASNAEVSHNQKSAPLDEQTESGAGATDMSQDDVSEADSEETREPAPTAAAQKGDSGLITDDEFENLLDELHGAGGAPGGAATEAELPAAPFEEMPAETANSPDNETHDWVELILDPTMVIAQVGELHERLCSLREEENTVGIAANEVNVIDTSNLQLLYAFMRDRAAQGNETLIHKPSESFINAASSLGMLEIMGLSA